MNVTRPHVLGGRVIELQNHRLYGMSQLLVHPLPAWIQLSQ